MKTRVLYFLLVSSVLLHALSAFAVQDTVTILFGGDAMQHSPQFQWAYDAKTDTYNYEPCFRYVRPYVQAADLSIVNLEVSLGGQPYSGYPNFSCPDSYEKALLDAGFDVLTLANNHILDRGKRGMLRTLDVIGETPNAGAYRDSVDRANRYPLLMTVKGLKVALFTCTYGCNGYTALPPTSVNLIDTAEIRRDLQSATSRQADLRIMYIHWGVEYQLQAVERQRQLARWLAEAGFDVIIGGHPHVVENAEVLEVERDGMKKHVPVIYSLGNLISNQRRTHTNGGVLARVRVYIGSRTATILDGGVRPMRLELDYLPCYVHKGTIRYRQADTTITERQYFLLPTTDYLSGKLPFRLVQEEESALRVFHDNTLNRLSNLPLYK